MARNYANIVTAIWRHPEFRALSSREQWLFLFLVTQPNISAVGVLPLTLGRWAGCAEDMTADAIRVGMATLQARRFIVFDPSTDEVLVRSFVRWDGGHTNPKRRPVIMRSAAEVESGMLRRAIAAEFDRLGLDSNGLVDSLSDRLPDADPPSPEIQQPKAELAAQAGHLDESSPDLFSQEDSLSDRQSGSVSPEHGVVVTKALVVDTATHTPQSATQTQPGGKPETLDQQANRITHVYTDVVTVSNFMGARQIVKKSLNDGYSEHRIVAALQQFIEHREKTITANLMRLVLEGKSLADIGAYAVRSSSEQVERNGMKLNPITASRMDDRARWADLDARLSSEDQPAIGAS